MGLIRKTFAVGTIGVVNPSSKKQRVARQTRDAIRELNATLLAAQAAAPPAPHAIRTSPPGTYPAPVTAPATAKPIIPTTPPGTHAEPVTAPATGKPINAARRAAIQAETRRRSGAFPKPEDKS